MKAVYKIWLAEDKGGECDPCYVFEDSTHQFSSVWGIRIPKLPWESEDIRAAEIKVTKMRKDHPLCTYEIHEVRKMEF